MIHRMYWVAFVALLALPVGAQGQRLLEIDGVGAAWARHSW